MKNFYCMTLLILVAILTNGCGGKVTEVKIPKEAKTHKQYLLNVNNEVFTNKINDLLLVKTDKSHKLWIATERGVFILDVLTKKTSHYTSENSILSDNRIYALAHDSDNNDIWVAGVDGLVVYRDGKFRQKFTIGDVYSVVILKSLGRKEIWAGTHEGVKQFNSGIWKTYNMKNSGLMDLKVVSLSPGKADHIWVGTVRGLHKIMSNRGQWERYTGPTTEYQGGSLAVIPGNSGLPSNQINSITSDKEGNIWVATNRGIGLYRNGQWSSYTADHKVLKMNFGTKKRVDVPGNSELCGNWIYDVFWLESQKTLYVATNNGVSIFTNFEKWSTLNTSGSKLPSNNVTAISADDKNIYAGTDSGLLIYEK